MSAPFRIQQKKKYSQNDLRKLMNEHRAKASESTTKIDSPLAKYNDQGQLMCILCQSIVRSEAVWKVHLNSKAHKENVVAAKALKERAQKRPATPPPAPAKKLKGILKNSNYTNDEPEVKKSEELPEDFFDTPNNSIIKRDLVKISRDQTKAQVEPEPIQTDTIPEGFFDDPRQDAKARHQEFKDPNDEEWDKFQKEIKEATNIATAIINEEQEEATTERQIEEIDEQITIWSRVLEIEKQKEKVVEKLKSQPEMMDHDGEPSDSDVEDEDLDEYLDWRVKKSHK